MKKCIPDLTYYAVFVLVVIAGVKIAQALNASGVCGIACYVVTGFAALVISAAVEYHVKLLVTGKGGGE